MYKIATLAAALVLCACGDGSGQGAGTKAQLEARKKQADELAALARAAEPAALELAALARAAEPAALERAPKILAAFVAEQERQNVGFSFEAKRYGEFLTVRVARLGNPEGSQRKFSTTLNLSLVHEIKLKPGHDADRDGTLTYACSNCTHTDIDTGWTITGIDVSSAPPEGATVAPVYPLAPRQRASYAASRGPAPAECQELTTIGSQIQVPLGGYVYIGPKPINYTTKGYPRPAEDDQVCFDGVGATLSVPHGKGQEVLDEILAEVARSK